MANIAKISVEKFDSKDQILFDFDKSTTLFENVKSICRETGVPESHVYGLKHQPTKINPASNFYVSERNFSNIKHSDCLKLVFSVQFLTGRLDNILDPNMRDLCFEDLLKLSVDPSFIEELVETRRDKKLVDLFINAELNHMEQKALLITILHLFLKGHILDTSKDILKKTLDILNDETTTVEELKYSLSILHKILISKNENFNEWKEKIIKKLSINNLIPYIWSKEYKDLQYGALLLINTIIRYCKGDKRQQLIKEMNLKQNRNYIYHSIILERNFDKNMEHELYVTQTYLLGLFHEALSSEIFLTSDTRTEFELCSDFIRSTILMDFDENLVGNQFNGSIETLPNSGSGQRISLSSILSENSTITTRSSMKCSSESEYDNNIINLLTLECLRHYKKFHYINFYQSQLEESLYEPGIFATSERVVQMMAKLLHIGLEPDSRSTSYQPLVFDCPRKTPFLHELFSRVMWLLSKTRREMKASTMADYPKVMRILEKQVKMVLEKKPLTFKILTEDILNATFKTAMEQIQLEKEQEMRQLIDSHPCIQELKISLNKENGAIVENQRINCLMNGSHFPRVLEKKTSGSIFVQLSKNGRELAVYDVVDIRTKEMKFRQSVIISNITHVVVGKNCKHAGLCTNPQLAFSLIENNNYEDQLKFIGKDERNTSYWTDALNILTGNDDRSRFFESELNDLVEMDIRLKLLDLQNVKIPKHPPIIPPPPVEFKPPIPEKPMMLRKKVASRIKRK